MIADLLAIIEFPLPPLPHTYTPQKVTPRLMQPKTRNRTNHAQLITQDKVYICADLSRRPQLK